VTTAKYMSTALIVTLATVVGTLSAASFGGRASTRQSQKRGSSIKHDLDVKGTPLEVSEYILRDSGFSGGVAEVLQGCAAEPQLQLKVKHGTSIRDAMTVLVTENPGYQWEEMDHAFVLFPRDGLPPLIETRIHDFLWDKKELWAAEGVLNAVMESPEVSKRAAELGLEPGPIEKFGGGIIGESADGQARKPRPIQIHVQDVTVVSAFNSVIRAYGGGIWQYVQQECQGKKTFNVYGEPY
jgi:hypothetical protein